MKPRCFYARRKLLPFIEADLSPREEARLKRHLTSCRACRETLERLRVGHMAARELGRLGSAATGPRPPEFAGLWAALGRASEGRARSFPSGALVLRALMTPLVAKVLVSVVLAVAALLVVSNRRMTWRTPAEADVLTAPAAREFTPVRITDFTPDTKSPVVTEGIVGAVYFDKEEQTLHIKLVDARHKPEPFVICEVHRPGGMAIPEEGSRIRVYGTARYDPQPGRGWNEVNPVTNIDVLKR
jgi:hypothetical protein